MVDIFEAIFSDHNDGEIITCGLFLPSEQNEAAISLSLSLSKKYEVEYVLDNEKRPPFLRLYETVYPKQNREKVIEAIRSISKLIFPIPMRWVDMEVEVHNIIVWGEITEELRQFQRMVLQILNPLRRGYYKQKYSNGKLLTSSEEKKSLLDWGSPWAENYIPHMIIAKSITKFPVGKLLDLEWGFRKCLFPGIIIGEKNSHGGFSQFQKFLFKK